MILIPSAHIFPSQVYIPVDYSTVMYETGTAVLILCNSVMSLITASFCTFQISKRSEKFRSEKISSEPREEASLY